LLHKQESIISLCITDLYPFLDQVDLILSKRLIFAHYQTWLQDVFIGLMIVLLTNQVNNLSNACISTPHPYYCSIDIPTKSRHIPLMTNEVKTRTRLSPEVRKNLILDHAAEVVAAEGVSALSMERLGREAGISKSLVYAYYPSMKDLLQILLKREYKRLRILQSKAAANAETFEQLVRLVTTTYLTYMEERGLILERLAAEPSLEDHGDPTEYSRETAVQYVAKVIRDNFDIDMSVALPAADISFGMPAAAGHYLIRHDVSRQTIEDITVAMIIGSVEGLKRNYATALKPLVKSTD
jgi:AcrR family transcriptional regulator